MLQVLLIASALAQKGTAVTLPAKVPGGAVTLPAKVPGGAVTLPAGIASEADLKCQMHEKIESEKYCKTETKGDRKTLLSGVNSVEDCAEAVKADPECGDTFHSNFGKGHTQDDCQCIKKDATCEPTKTSWRNDIYKLRECDFTEKCAMLFTNHRDGWPGALPHGDLDAAKDKLDDLMNQDAKDKLDDAKGKLDDLVNQDAKDKLDDAKGKLDDLMNQDEKDKAKAGLDDAKDKLGNLVNDVKGKIDKDDAKDKLDDAKGKLDDLLNQAKQPCEVHKKIKSSMYCKGDRKTLTDSVNSIEECADAVKADPECGDTFHSNFGKGHSQNDCQCIKKGVTCQQTKSSWKNDIYELRECAAGTNLIAGVSHLLPKKQRSKFTAEPTPSGATSSHIWRDVLIGSTGFVLGLGAFAGVSRFTAKKGKYGTPDTAANQKVDAGDEA